MNQEEVEGLISAYEKRIETLLDIIQQKDVCINELIARNIALSSEMARIALEVCRMERQANEKE